MIVTVVEDVTQKAFITMESKDNGLVKSVALSLPDADKYGQLVAEMDAKVAKHHQYIRDEGTDLPEVENWEWKPLD